MSEKTQKTKWWCVEYGYSIKISSVGVTKETEHTLTLSDQGHKGSWYENRRVNKQSDGTRYFRFFSDAKDFAIQEAQRRAKRAQANLDDANETIIKLKAMTGEQ